MAAAGRLTLAILLLAATGAPAHAQAGDVERGRRLFLGEARFARGGPPCAACHDDAALPDPGGGTMGPDLTNIYGHIGPEGVTTAVETLYFPTMMPLFSAHPLTRDERAAIVAYLQSTNGRPARGQAATASLGGASVVGFAILMIVTAFAGRSRIRSVRHALLARAAGARDAR